MNPQRREVRIALDDPGERLADDPGWLYFGPLNAERPLRCKAEAVREAGDEWVAVLAAGVPRDTVAGLRGQSVAVTEAAVEPEVAPLTFDEVLGMRVVQNSGAALGVVAGVLESPGQAVLRIERDDGTALLVPLAEPVVVAVDLEARVLTLVDDLTPYAVEEE